MSIFSKWFSSSAKPPQVAASLIYKDYLIEALPYQDGGQWQLAGRITRGERVHSFVRADKFSSREEAAQLALSKGQLIVDQSGDRIFA